MSNTDVGIKLFNFLECNNLVQLVNEPTRITQSGESILDLICSDSPGVFVSKGTLSPPSNCDHNIIFGKLSISVYKPKCFKRKVRNFNVIDEVPLNVLLNAGWDDIFFENTASNIDVIYEKWRALFLSIVHRFIPSKIVMIRPNDKPWMNGAIRRAIRKHDRLLRAFNMLQYA